MSCLPAWLRSLSLLRKGFRQEQRDRQARQAYLDARARQEYLAGYRAYQTCLGPDRR